MVLAAAPAQAQTPAPAASADTPARGPQTNWWSQAGGENGLNASSGQPRRHRKRPTPESTSQFGISPDILARIKGRRAGRERGSDGGGDFDGRYVQMVSGDKAKLPVLRRRPRVRLGLQRCCEDDDRLARSPRSSRRAGRSTWHHACPTAWRQSAPSRLCIIANTPAGQVPSYPESETPAPVPGYTCTSRPRSLRPAATTHSTCRSYQ